VLEKQPAGDVRQEVGEQDGRRSSAGGECGPDGKPQGGEALLARQWADGFALRLRRGMALIRLD
jgi:hypothetical protein